MRISELIEHQQGVACSQSGSRRFHSKIHMELRVEKLTSENAGRGGVWILLANFKIKKVASPILRGVATEGEGILCSAFVVLPSLRF